MSLTVNLPCIAGTSLSYHSPSDNFASRSAFFTSHAYYDFNEATKIEQGYADIPNVWYWDAGVAVLRFDGNNVLHKKNIKKATLKFTIIAYNSNVQNFPYVRYNRPGGRYLAGITHWNTDIDLSTLTLNNRSSKNFPTNEGQFFDLSDTVPTNTDSADIEIDITSRFYDWNPEQESTFVIGIGLQDPNYNFPTVTNDARQPLGNDEASRSILKSSAYIEIEYENYKPYVSPTAPINKSFVENEPILFSWNYGSSAESPQASATIEYKLSSASTWTTVTSSGAGTTYTLNAGLSAGSYEWRVKVTDEQGETSSYSATKTFTVVEQAAPTPTYPVDTGLPAYAPIAFTWTFNKPSGSSATQAGATLQYRDRGGSTWTDVTVSGSSATYTLQAGLAVGQYEWRVKVTNNYGNDSAYCNIKYFQIVAQSAPTPVSPGDNITLFEGHDITFTWIYNSLTPATQTSATIKYRVRGGSTWTTYTSTSSNPYCTISDIPQGQYEWCLNITNNYGETSADSSTLEFNIIGRPQKPIILEPDNCCLTTISWNAEGQEAAEFILMDGDGNVLIHETVATAVTSYKPQMFLKGSYKALARIKNNSDLWSDYGELEFDIDAAEPDPGNLIAMPFDTEIHLEGTYTSTNVAIVRIDEDGTETVLAMDDHAVDKKVAGGTEYAYVLRSWNTGGYIDTPAKVFDFTFEGAIFSTETEELHLDRSEQKFLAHDEEIERQYAQMRYVGREFAVIERGEYTEQTLSKQFHVTKAQRRILDRMAKEKSLFYRDSRGNAFKAAILNVSYSNYMGNDYIASIRLTRTAADEVIINV